MIYRLLADFVLIAHFLFVIFAAFGGLLVLRRRWIWKLHLPAVVWGFLVQYFLWRCPLTDWENHFRRLGGEAGYAGGFVEHFIVSIIYPGFEPHIHTFLAVSLVVLNLIIYSYLFVSFQRK